MKRNWPIADRFVLGNNPNNISAPVSLLFSKVANDLPENTQVTFTSLSIVITRLGKLVENQVMIDRMFVTFHHHPIGLTDHVSSHSTVSSDLRRASVKAKSIFGAVINPVLFHNKVSLALYLRLYPRTVVLQHPPAGSADVV